MNHRYVTVNQKDPYQSFMLLLTDHYGRPMINATDLFSGKSALQGAALAFNYRNAPCRNPQSLQTRASVHFGPRNGLQL